MKQKLLALCLTLVMLVTMLPGTALAAQAPVLSVGTATVEAGGTGSVTVSISGNTGFDTVSFQIAETEGLTINSVSVEEGICAGWNSDYGAEQRKFSAYSTTGATSNGVVCTINFTANDSASGSITINLVEDTNADGILMLNDNAVDGVTFTPGSVTVNAAAPASEYTASISTTGTEFKVNDSVDVTVNVGGSVGNFASSEVTLGYDPNYLTFEQSASTLNGAGVDVTTTGTIKLVDHGETQENGEAYVLKFTAKAATTEATVVTLTDARFSTAENAISYNLTEATGENAVNLTIKNADLNVTLPESDVVTGNTTVPYGGSYTFSAKNSTTYMYYDYTVSATMGGVSTTVKDNKNGTWTIENVTGALNITVTETPKTYSVTVKGDSTVTSEEVNQVTTTGVTAGKATYNTAVTYTLPNGQGPSGVVDGYHFEATVTVGGTSYTPSASDQTYTIAGDKVTGDIVITLSKVVDKADSVTVSIEGSSEIKKDSDFVTSFTAKKNTNVTLTLVPEVGYTYEIKADDKKLEIGEDNTFTVEVGTSAVTITVTKTLDTSSVKVQEYIQLDSTVMWLVTINGNGTTEISGKTYTYDDQNMFWSSKYQAYCYLVVADTLSAEDAKSKIGNTLATAEVVRVAYDMDVNNTSGKVDANDAQLVYNMYQTKAYSEFNATDRGMIKFLEADLNDTVGVNSGDAQVIINKLLNPTT